MKTFWDNVAHYAVKFAIYAAGHPDEVVKIVGVVRAL